MDKLTALCKSRGFIFPGSEIYGGMANSWDYGPLGVELKNNVKALWWKMFVQERLDMVGIDAALVMNPKVWEASGHLATFTDPLVECKQCHERYRADKIDLSRACQKCGNSGTFTEPASFNLMMKTWIGPKEDVANVAYFRPETAQAIFVDFPQTLMTSRKRIPFGIAQIGRAFRNEITPGNFIFRTREFDQMEIEYFVHPGEWEKHFEAWLKQMHDFIAACGIPAGKVHDHEIASADLAHYSKRTVDIEFDYPFGQEELYGLAYRGDFDLTNHGKATGKDITYTDPVSNEKYVPHVIEPSFGLDRTILAVMLSASGPPWRYTYQVSSLAAAMPRTYAELPAARTTRSPCVAMIVGALSRPSGSIASGRLRNGSMAEAGMLGIPWRARDSARLRGPSFTESISPEPLAPPPAPPVPPMESWPRARSSRITYPG